MTNAQITQVGAEVWVKTSQNNPNAKVAQVGAEVWVKVPANNPKAKIAHLGAIAWVKTLSPPGTTGIPPFLWINT